MTPQLLLLLVDAFSFEYLRWMPFLQDLERAGKAYSVRPAAGFRGVEPALNGEWTLPGEVPFRFQKTESEPSRFPPLIGLGDRILLPSLNRIYRLFLSRLTGTQYPHLIPNSLLGGLGVSSGTSRIPAVIREWENSGRSVWWYTRDSRWEKKKAFTARVYRKFYRLRMLGEALEAIQEGKDVVYLEFSTALDAVGHRYGPNSNEMEKSCRELDNQLRVWIGKARQLTEDLSVGVISDHGMSEATHTMDIEATLKDSGLINGKDYLGIWNSNFAQVWQMGSTLEEFRDSIAELPEVQVLEEIEREKWFGSDRSYGELILETTEGSLFLPNHFQGSQSVLGMHGYFNAQTPESRALALFSGPYFPILTENQIEMTQLFEILKG